MTTNQWDKDIDPMSKGMKKKNFMLYSGSSQDMVTRSGMVRHIEEGNRHGLQGVIYGVYQSQVNRIVYRKSNHPVKQWLHNGMSRKTDMPRNYKNFCPSCTEICGPRITQGVYLPLEHQCNSVRVYDLRGKLLEVKKL